jgi:hypothetical protein
MIRWQQTLLMRMIMSHLNKLSKETRDRHFPELNGGKGSKRRTETNESRKKYEDNYDKIFSKKDK